MNTPEQQIEVYRSALYAIANQFAGFYLEDLTRMEKNALRYASNVLKLDAIPNLSGQIEITPKS